MRLPRLVSTELVEIFLATRRNSRAANITEAVAQVAELMPSRFACNSEAHTKYPLSPRSLLPPTTEKVFESGYIDWLDLNANRIE
jgi:hypothetical protein